MLEKARARCSAPVDPSSPDRKCAALLPVEFKEIASPDGGKTPGRLDPFIRCASHGARGVDLADFITENASK